MTYGTGAIMAVPGHDERDHEFASTFDIPIVEVVSGGEAPIKAAPFEGDGVCVNSGFLNGLQVADAKEKMIDWLESEEKGSRQVQYRLRDWLFSRQRYWGEPFPLAHLEDGTIVQLPDEALPVELPPIDAYKPTEDGKPPLARADEEWLKVTLPDGTVATRENEHHATMGGFVLVLSPFPRCTQYRSTF